MLMRATPRQRDPGRRGKQQTCLDFAKSGFLYPGVTMGARIRTAGLAGSLLGPPRNPTPEMVEPFFSNEKQVTEKTPPNFLFSSPQTTTHGHLLCVWCVSGRAARSVNETPLITVVGMRGCALPACRASFTAPHADATNTLDHLSVVAVRIGPSIAPPRPAVRLFSALALLNHRITRSAKSKVRPAAPGRAEPSDAVFGWLRPCRPQRKP